MKNQWTVLAVVLALGPSLASGQAPCKPGPRSPTVIRPYFPVEYAYYQGDGCLPRKRTAGGVPVTVRNMIRTLDCLIPCGPRSGHGCGITCIGAGSGCLPGYSHRDIMYCPTCGSKPFACCCCVTSPSYALGGPIHHACQFDPCYEGVPTEAPLEAPGKKSQP